MQRPFPAYDGNDPYVFVSYAHEDGHAVYDEIRTLRDAGINIWYDEGIQPGSRWTDELANRITNAALVIWLITPSSVRSENCRNEIEFALKHRRRILPVYLQAAELPGGLSLALSGYQAIFQEQHSATDYRQKLLQAIAKLTEGSGVEVDVQSPAIRRRRRAGYAAVAFVALFSAAIASYLHFSQREVAVRNEPLPLLVANFSNETGQPVFDGVLEEALKIGMEGAPFITSYPRENARRVLKGLSANDVLTQEGARLVAVHEGLELVLAGSVRRNGARYELRVDGVDPLSGETRVSASEGADSPLDALKAIATLAGTLREKLGDVTKRHSALDEIFTASSIDAVVEFAKAQALAANWRHAEAMSHYERAVAEDAKFGRAYGGWAFSASVLGQIELSKRLWEKCLALLDTMTERERLRTLGIYYMTITGNVEKAIESYRALVDQYPADAAARNNLAVAYFTRGDFVKARDEGGSLLEIYPNSLLYLSNYALYNMYIAEMQTSVEYAMRVLAIDPKHYIAYLPLALNALLETDYAKAEEQLAAMAAGEDGGTSLAALGRADLLLARGDYAAAESLLERGAADDDAAGDAYSATIKRIALARSLLAAGKNANASATLAGIVNVQAADRHEVESAELQIALGNPDAAKASADRLATKVAALSRAYAGYINGKIALADGKPLLAIEALSASIAQRDTWLARYARGTAYMQAGYSVEAKDDFDVAWNRRGEAVAAFLDDTPSYHRLVDLYYWRARAEEPSAPASALENYQRFVRAKDRASSDPLVIDARRRLQALKSAA